MPEFRIINMLGDEILHIDPGDAAEGKTISVGRSSQCTLSLKSSLAVGRRVGAHHFSLVKREGRWRAVCAGSTGITKNGEPAKDAVVNDGDRIKFGDCFLLVGAAVGISMYELFWEDRFGQVQHAPLWPGKNLIGTSSKCTITAQDCPGCSRQHACITVEKEALTLEDLQSANGTRFRGKSVLEPTSIEPGDRFKAGKTKMWVDRNETAGEYVGHPTLLSNRYFRLFLLLIILLWLVIIKDYIFPK